MASSRLKNFSILGTPIEATRSRNWDTGTYGKHQTRNLKLLMHQQRPARGEIETLGPTPKAGDPSVLDANYPPNLLVAGGPLGRGGEGGHGRGGVLGVNWGGGLPGGSVGGRGPGGAIWGGGGGGATAPLTSPCPSDHAITMNLTLTFAAS